ncbi:MAG: hemolysin III family protein [Candidatus Cloacimonetes bacterium]|nr:hemolysin III family protein [Candidatus Cloacimonadota bacterium]
MTTRERLFDRIHMLTSQTLQEEIASGIIHGIGILISIAALVLLVVFASLQHNVNQVVSFAIFGGFAVFYYLCSTFHHSLMHYKAKRIFRIMEQSAVYLFITGTIFPLNLVILQSSLGWSIFIVTAVLCLIGILNLFFNKRNSADIGFIINLLLILFLIVTLIICLKFFSASFKIFFIPGAILYLVSFWFASMNGMKYNQAYAHAITLAATILHFFAFFQLINL